MANIRSILALRCDSTLSPTHLDHRVGLFDRCPVDREGSNAWRPATIRRMTSSEAAYLSRWQGGRVTSAWCPGLGEDVEQPGAWYRVARGQLAPRWSRGHPRLDVDNPLWPGKEMKMARRTVKTPKRAEVYQRETTAGVFAPRSWDTGPVQEAPRAETVPVRRLAGSVTRMGRTEWCPRTGRVAARAVERAPHFRRRTLLRRDSRTFGYVRDSRVADAVTELKRLGQPFLNWAGQSGAATRSTLPTLPLFVHERLSTKAIVETLKAHDARPANGHATLRRSTALTCAAARSVRTHGRVGEPADPRGLASRHELAAEYEGLGGQVQMIYIDPPYGVKFGSTSSRSSGVGTCGTTMTTT